MRNWLASGWLLAALLISPALTPTAHAAGNDPYTHFFSETFGDFAEELAQAKAEGKQGVLVFFEMDECPFCHYMKKNVLNQPEVQSYYREHFLNLVVDIEGDVEITDFEGNSTTQKAWAEKNRVRATPVIAFFDLDGKQIHRHTGRTAGTEEFLWMGEYVAKAIYKQKSFSAFKREKKKGS
jgi:thioredoxin-related protein